MTRKLTLDYGLRWDLATTPRETDGRLGQLDETLANANAGGHPGAVQYASTCGCTFYEKSYPYAIGPRVGVAYQVTPRTVIRGGWGVIYAFVFGTAGSVVSTNGVYPVAANSPSYVPTAYQYVNIETPGAIVQPAWPVTNPNIYPNPGTTAPAPVAPDANQNRPPRINQFSFGIQQEITRNFIMEATYVGNRAAWVQQAGGPLGFLSQISPAQYAQYGLYPYPGTGPAGYNNNNDRVLLADPISSTAVTQALAARGITNILPYAGFPTSSTLQSALYPFPQFGAIAIDGFSDRRLQVRFFTNEGDQAFWARFPGRWNVHLGARLHSGYPPGLLQPCQRRVGAAADPAAGSQFQLHLYRAEVQAPAPICERNRQGLADRRVRQLPERHVPDASSEPDGELPDQRGRTSRGPALV